MAHHSDSATVGMWLPFATALAACSPSPQEAAVRSPSPTSPVPPDAVEASSTPHAPALAMMGPVPQPVSAADSPAPVVDTPEEARGRRTLSTAFVRVGPDGHLTVERHDGHVIVLRDVVMRAKSYCGIQATGGGAKYCGNYAEIADARPGGLPTRAEPDLAAENPAPPSAGKPR